MTAPTDDLQAASSRPDRLLSTLEQLLAIDATELEPALREAADIVAAVLEADKVDVFLYEPSTKSLVARGTSDTAMGHRQHEVGLHRLPLAGRGRAVEVFESGRCYQTGRADADAQELIGLTEGLGIRSEIVVPLNFGGRPTGVVVAASAEPDFFGEQDMPFLEAVSRWTSMVMHRTELTRALMGRAEDRGRREAMECLIAQLTPRQLEVAILIANGYSNQQIAERLVVTTGTVANHVAEMLDRLGVQSRTQVATLVAELGMHRRQVCEGPGLPGQAWRA
jgi:DNA-binding CsgD family transcriptional regulator